MTRASVRSGSPAARSPGPRPAPRAGRPGPPGPAPARIAGGSIGARWPVPLFHGRLAPRPSGVVAATRPKKPARGSRPRERRDRTRCHAPRARSLGNRRRPSRSRGSQSRRAPRREPGGSPVSAITPKKAATRATVATALRRGGNDFASCPSTPKARVTAQPCQDAGLHPQPQRFGPNHAVSVRRAISPDVSAARIGRPQYRCPGARGGHQVQQQRSPVIRKVRCASR